MLTAIYLNENLFCEVIRNEEAQGDAFTIDLGMAKKERDDLLIASLGGRIGAVHLFWEFYTNDVADSANDSSCSD